MAPAPPLVWASMAPPRSPTGRSRPGSPPPSTPPMRHGRRGRPEDHGIAVSVGLARLLRRPELAPLLLYDHLGRDLRGDLRPCLQRRVGEVVLEVRAASLPGGSGSRIRPRCRLVQGRWVRLRPHPCLGLLAVTSS